MRKLHVAPSQIILFIGIFAFGLTTIIGRVDDDEKVVEILRIGAGGDNCFEDILHRSAFK